MLIQLIFQLVLNFVSKLSKKEQVTTSNILKLLGDWLGGSALVQAAIANTGRAESIEKGSHVTRTRCAHQLTSASLYVLQMSAYNTYQESQFISEHCHSMIGAVSSISIIHNSSTGPSNVLQFIRSLREGDFEIDIQNLGQIVPWLFALDHTSMHCGYQYTSVICCK